MEKRKMKILVPVDGSNNSKRAILEARRHLKMFDCELSLLTVVHPSFPGSQLFKDYENKGEIKDQQDGHSQSHPALEEALGILKKTPAEISTQLLVGDAADEILRLAEEGNYDLIIMGSRGLGRFSKTFLGSVSNKVLNHAKTNVLIVK